MESDFEKLLIAEQSNGNAILLQLLTSSYDENTLIVFVEGKNDIVFYFDFVVRYSGCDDPMFIDCGGKRGVISIDAFLHNYQLGVSPKGILFLADRDFDDVMGYHRSAGIWLTDYYSIESYFAQDSFIIYLMSKFMAGSIKGISKRALSASISNAHQIISRKVLGPMALLCLMRAKGSAFSFDDIDIADLLKLDNKPVVERARKRSRRIIERLGTNAKPYTFNELMFVVRRMYGLDSAFWVRGKLNLQLLKIATRSAVANSSNANNPIFSGIAHHLGSGCLQMGAAYLLELEGLNRYIAKRVTA